MKEVKAKNIVITFQIISFIFLLFFIVSTLFTKNGYEVLIFGNICLYIVEATGLFLFLLTEFIMFIVIAIKKKKPLFIIVNILLLPLLIFGLIAADFALTCKPDAQVYSYNEFNKDIAIVNRSFLLSGESYIFEKNGVLLELIASVSGDDGYCPLRDKNDFQVEIDGNTITYTYHFDGYSQNEDNKRKVVLEYKNEHFECIKEEHDYYYD